MRVTSNWGGPRPGRLASVVGLALGVLPWIAAQDLAGAPPPSPRPPVTRRVEQIDVYHGAEVADPYRWLEEADGPETRAWIDEQNRITFDYLDQIAQRPAIRRQLERLWNYEKYSPPVQRGGLYFFTKNDGLQNQSVVYVSEGWDAAPRVLLDPNRLSADGTVALSGLVPSPSGHLVAYGTSVAGSDWQVWRIRETAIGCDLDDELKWIKFSGASWADDGSGIFYSRYDEPREGGSLVDTNYYQKLYFHRIGTPQTKDILVYDRPDQKEWGFRGEVTDDGAYLVITVSRGTDERNGVFYLPLASEPAAGGQPAAADSAGPLADRLQAARVVELLADFDAQYEFLGNDGPNFWFRTDDQAPRGRVIAIDVRRPQRDAWREVIPEGTATLEAVVIAGERFMCHYLVDAHSRLALHTLSGESAGEVALPGLGTVGAMEGRPDDPQAFYSFSSFATPGEIFRLEPQTATAQVWKRPNLAFNPADFVTRQVFCTSRDGTRVPLFITHHRRVEPNPQTPALLFGYGGFNITLPPRFSVAHLAWMEWGGIYAQAVLRGGGEYGREWHEAGQKLNKQNVFDDFIAAAEWLIDQRQTSPGKLAISGRSNGGLLVAAVMAQRPELFAAALPAVGVLDMLRFHKFTIGWAWVPEYGSADDPEQFAVLRGYSPLHNLKPDGRYPATLITTADHDDRVVPAHSYKFAAALQAVQQGPAPILIRIDTDAGHGAGKPTAKSIDEAADILAFLVANLGVELPPEMPAEPARADE